MKKEEKDDKTKQKEGSEIREDANDEEGARRRKDRNTE